MKKYFKNVTATSADIYVYGDIVDDSFNWFTESKDEFDFDPMDLKDELDELNGINEINIYINSGGGSVFAASTMVSMLKRYKEQNKVTINTFVDGLCASAATYILMAADNINIYDNSVVMIHKPMTFSYGNAEQLAKDIEVLNTLENDVMIPMYLSKAIVDKEEIKNLISAETWFAGSVDSPMYVGNFFEVNHIEENKQVAACTSALFDKYTNTPQKFKNATASAKTAENANEDKPEQPKADNSLYNYKIKLLKIMEV